MGIGAIELNGAIPRVQDYAIQRTGEDSKILSDQAALVQGVKKESENKTTVVNKGDDTANNPGRFDAREKGSNEYAGDGGKNRKGNAGRDEGKVFIKGAAGSFDIRI